jgi:hypothetical protein
MLRRNVHYSALCLFILLLAFPLQTPAQKQKDNTAKLTGPSVFWHEPTDLESRNLLNGAGGDSMKPDLSRLTFIEEKKGGYSTKYRVRDAAGNEWIAKLGKEAQPDTAANRLLWALGYETEIAYLVPKVTIEGKGDFENVRLEARPKNVERSGTWKWEENPFKGKPEFQGLKIMMVMINNWDMKDDNNEILVSRDDTTGEVVQRYIISDLGGSFGKTGGIISRSRNKPSDYVKAEFIEKLNGNVIDFHYSGKNKKLFDNITVADAHWLSGLLTRLSDDQIKDAFRAANYPAAETDELSAAFRERINALASVGK